MKVPDVLVKVFEPGRLQMAWQQVRKNAGAAGIDQMTVEEFAQRDRCAIGKSCSAGDGGDDSVPGGRTWA